MTKTIAYPWIPDQGCVGDAFDTSPMPKGATLVVRCNGERLMTYAYDRPAGWVRHYMVDEFGEPLVQWITGPDGQACPQAAMAVAHGFVTTEWA